MDKSYFLTENYLYKPGIALATSNPGDDGEDTYDYNLTTYWESVNPPNSPCYINFLLDDSYDINTVWLKADNLDEYRVYEWSGVAWTLIGSYNPDANGIGFETFTGVINDFWRLEFFASGAGTIKIYEVFWMKHLHTLQASDDNLASNIIVTPIDSIGGVYLMADGSYTSYRGIKIYHNITYEYEFTPKANRDSLYNIYYSSDYGIRPNIVVYPNPDEYPEGIYRVVFENIDFPFSHTIPFKGSGWSGSLNFKEH